MNGEILPRNYLGSNKSPKDQSYRMSSGKARGIIKKKKKRLPPDAEVSAAEMVLCKELACRAETANYFH